MKIDLHVHTSEVSSCGHVPAAEMARLYHEAGYDAIVITDHLIAGNKQEMPMPERVNWYLSGYRAAKAEGEKLGLTVLLGAEARMTSGNEDFLVFGCETKGLPESLLQRVYDRCVRIPMRADARSLNLANSVAIVVYEALRQQGFPGLSQMGALTGRQDEAAPWMDYV